MTSTKSDKDSASGADVVLFGTGNVAEVITVYLERFSDLNIVGYTVDADYLPMARSFMGKQVVPWDKIKSYYPPGQVRLMGPLTYQRLNQVRRDRYLEGKTMGYAFASFIHPASHILTDSIGEHVIILEQNVIQPFVEIGDNVILWSFNHIGHHVKLGSHSFVASLVGVSGNTKIGEQCYIGGGVGFNQGLKVGDRCAFLGQVVVDKDVPDDTTLIGRPQDVRRIPSARIAKLL